MPQSRQAEVAAASQALASIHIDDLSVRVSRPTKVGTTNATLKNAADCKNMFRDPPKSGRQGPVDRIVASHFR
jgi:hypothetical protein